MSDFVKVSTVEDVPTDTGKLVEVDGIPVALFKSGNEVYAIDPSCPHQGGPLNEGGFREGKAMCPWHGWEFDVKTGACSFNDEIKVAVYQVKIDGNDVLVKI